jgi:hypothetical protein
LLGSTYAFRLNATVPTVLPNDLHDTNKMRIATGAYWPFLADIDPKVQQALQIEEYTDPITTRPCRTRSS